MKKIISLLLLSLIFLSLFACENKNGWYGDYYYDNNKKVKNEWRQYGDDWYYCGPKGEILKNTWVEDEYYVDESGKMLMNTFTPDGYFVGADGKYVQLTEAQIGIMNGTTIKNCNSSSSVENMYAIKFGHYPQSSANLNEPIEWIILEKDDVNKQALILSKYILDCKSYNNQRKNCTWETCDLRNWLNNTFYKNAFSENDKLYIISSYNVNHNNIEENTYGGNNTTDKVFCLSAEEYSKYFSRFYTEYGYRPGGYNIPAITTGTNYAKSIIHNGFSLYHNGFSLYPNGKDRIDCGSPYWLRGSGFKQDAAMTVDDDGLARSGGWWVECGYRDGDAGSYEGYCVGVRPAIWVKYK